MNESQEKDMRAQIGDYTQTELSNLAIQLQNTIDDHIAEKRGQANAVEQMRRQNDALQVENTRLENEAGDSIPHNEVVELEAKVGTLTARVVELTQLNEGLQRKLLA